jgi:hypothetical protein
MFKVVILVHAVVSGWHDIYRVGTAFHSFKLCEAADQNSLMTSDSS